MTSEEWTTNRFSADPMVIKRIASDERQCGPVEGVDGVVRMLPLVSKTKPRLTGVSSEEKCWIF